MLCPGNLQDLKHSDYSDFLSIWRIRIDYIFISIILALYIGTLVWNVTRGPNILFVNIQASYNIVWCTLLITAGILNNRYLCGDTKSESLQNWYLALYYLAEAFFFQSMWHFSWRYWKISQFCLSELLEMTDEQMHRQRIALLIGTGIIAFLAIFQCIFSGSRDTKTANILLHIILPILEIIPILVTFTLAYYRILRHVMANQTDGRKFFHTLHICMLVFLVPSTLISIAGYQSTQQTSMASLITYSFSRYIVSLIMLAILVQASSSQSKSVNDLEEKKQKIKMRTTETLLTV